MMNIIYICIDLSLIFVTPVYKLITLLIRLSINASIILNFKLQTK